jgi:hypothetical protein
MAVVRSQWRKGGMAFGVRASGKRHPLVAAVMALPLAVLLAVVFGGWDLSAIGPVGTGVDGTNARTVGEPSGHHVRVTRRG